MLEYGNLSPLEFEYVCQDVMQAKLERLEDENKQSEAAEAKLREENAQNREIIKKNAEIMKQNAELIRELTKKLEAKR